MDPLVPGLKPVKINGKTPIDLVRFRSSPLGLKADLVVGTLAGGKKT